MAYFKVLSQNFPAGIEENQKNSELGYPACGLEIESRAS